jgi:hypothetical protein
VVDSGEDLATVVEARHAAAADEGAHCVQRKVEEFGTAAGVAADHTVAAVGMLAERSWDDNSEQTKERVEEYAAWEVAEGAAVGADHDEAGHAAERVDRSAIVGPSSQHLVDLAGQELEDLCTVQDSAGH